jgi:hypothetical protein
MKESERIKLEAEADTSDNDFRDTNYLRKIERAERFEKFEEDILPLLNNCISIKKEDNKFVIKTYKFGKLTFYPKANSIQFHNDGFWIKHYGLKWIKKYLIR